MKLCPKCNTQLEDEYMFCTECGTRLTPEEAPASEQVQVGDSATDVIADAAATPEEIAKVDGHIIWNLQPGQVARKISEAEFANYSNASGIIISEGTRLLARSNAEEYTMMSSGIYTFPSREKEPNKNSVRNIFKPSQTASKETPANPEFRSLLLVRDGDFPVIFGGADSTEDNFVPMDIPAKNLTVQVGVSVMLRISSMQVFSLKWMVDRKSISAADIMKLLSSRAEAIIRECLADVYISESGLTEVVKKEISERIMAMSPSLGGISVSSVQEIRVGSEELERFQALNSELYLSGRELEYLERTNEFKNRLAIAQNNQQIEEAKNDLALMRALQKLNQDKILAEDELEKFYMVLSREKKIREAQNQEQIDAALADIERTGLIRAEDLNRLKDEIRSEEHRRGHAFRMMQKKDELELESLQREFDRRAREEDYEFEKRKKDDEFDRFKELQKMRSEQEAAEHDRNMEALRQMQQAKLEKLKLSKELTPEQLLALAANENLAPEAAAALAQSLGKGRDAEAERRHQEEIQRLTEQRIADMKDMSKTEHDTVRELIRSMAPGAAGQQAQGMTAGSNAGGAASGAKFCPKCGAKCAEEARFCMSCGHQFN